MCFIGEHILREMNISDSDPVFIFPIFKDSGNLFAISRHRFYLFYPLPASGYYSGRISKFMRLEFIFRIPSGRICDFF